MHTINVAFDDNEWRRLLAKKGEISWRGYILATLQSVDKLAWKKRVKERLPHGGVKDIDYLLDAAFEELNAK